MDTPEYRGSPKKRSATGLARSNIAQTDAEVKGRLTIFGLSTGTKKRHRGPQGPAGGPAQGLREAQPLQRGATPPIRALRPLEPPAGAAGRGVAGERVTTPTAAKGRTRPGAPSAARRGAPGTGQTTQDNTAASTRSYARPSTAPWARRQNHAARGRQDRRTQNPRRVTDAAARARGGPLCGGEAPGASQVAPGLFKSRAPGGPKPPEEPAPWRAGNNAPASRPQAPGGAGAARGQAKARPLTERGLRETRRGSRARDHPRQEQAGRGGRAGAAAAPREHTAASTSSQPKGCTAAASTPAKGARPDLPRGPAPRRWARERSL